MTSVVLGPQIILYGTKYYFSIEVQLISIFPGGAVVKNLPANDGNTKRHKFNSWVGKMLWSRKWQPAPVFLPGRSHGQRCLVDYSSWGYSQTQLNNRTHAQLISDAVLLSGVLILLIKFSLSTYCILGTVSMPILVRYILIHEFKLKSVLCPNPCSFHQAEILG